MKFSLRDLFWLIALVAMGCGWWVDRADRQRVASRLNSLEVEKEMWASRAEAMRGWIERGDELEVWYDGREVEIGAEGTVVPRLK
jgi:hypothetical protein